MMRKPAIVLVVAVAQNGVIGREGELPWRLRDDLQWFKRTTLGKPVIMGRSTWESIGRPLPGRTNIVLSRALDTLEGAYVARSLEEALRLASAHDPDAEEICIIGGGDIYRQAMEMTKRLYLTIVEADVDGDTVFDVPDPSDWRITEIGRIERGDDNDYAARIERWDRNDRA